MRRTFRLLAIVAVLVLPASTFAHDVSTSYSRLTVEGQRVRVHFTISLLEFHNGPQFDRDRDDKVTPAEFEGSLQTLLDAMSRHYVLTAPDSTGTFELERHELQGDSVMRLEFVFSFPNEVKDLVVRSTLPTITQADHQHFLVMGEGDNTRQAVLDIKNPSIAIDVDGPTSFEVFWDFLRLGGEHIITGYDHLAFLTGLLLTTTTLGALVKVVTAFTVAHSVTLGLATFDIVSLPPRLIESLIALSIAYIAIENFTGKMFVHRWKITFLFGLVHGFGFSNILREMELTRQHLAISLFSFNAGVEVGQLLFVAVLFPLVVVAVRSKWKEQFLSTASLVIMALGFYWFVQRAFLT